MGYLLELVIIGFGLYALRNLVAMPIAFILRMAGVQNSTDKARYFVGTTSSIVYFGICCFGLYVFWHMGVVQVFGEAFGVIFSSLFDFLKLLPAAIAELLA
jgi:hypothetical protein